MIEPFAVRVPQEELDDLRERIRRTRWPGPETDAGQGMPLATMRELCAYWAGAYDWRAAEARLNAFPQFRRDGIHFVHARSPREDALPLILTHGWPGSVLEFLKVIEPLSRDFHVVVPSLPGYGFSDERAGWGVERIADAWVELMHALGYERFGAAGSDWGTTISTLIGSRAVGIHCSRRWPRPSATWSRRHVRRPHWPIWETRPAPGTRTSTRPARRPSATRCSTPRPACSRGSARSCSTGRTSGPPTTRSWTR